MNDQFGNKRFHSDDLEQLRPEDFHALNTLGRGFRSFTDEPPHARLLRRGRLFLIKWGPVVHVATMASVILLAWFFYQQKMVPAPPSSLSSQHQASEQVAPVVASIAFTSQPAADIVATDPGWPWNTCNYPNITINQWLGQGRARGAIDDMVRTIDQATTGNMAVRETTAHKWCSSLSAGTGRLMKTLRREVRESSSK
jgi:hypothetical protein